MIKGVGYTRTATVTQADATNSIKTQAERIIGYCNDNSIDLVGIFSDVAKSGLKPFNNAALKLMIGNFGKRNTDIDVVVITSVDRLSRNESDLNVFRKLLDIKGIKLIILNDL